MRNLKKVGCLILCLALMMSVAVFNVGAAFSDQKDIQHTEAVGMCTALNIISGYPDGSYKPAGNITRAEMCKMICVALNGGNNPVLSTKDTPTFSDVRTDKNSAWAEAYIESCYSQGIVSGVGGGLFNPSGSITGTQAAKMLLVALGYQSDKASYTGASWAINVNVDASNRGLYKELSTMDPSAALTRDNAAQMIWNALKAYEVEYKSTLTTDKNGQLVSSTTVADKVVGSNNDKIDLLTDKYNTVDTDYTTGTLSQFEYNSTKKEFTYYLSKIGDDAAYAGKTEDSNKKAVPASYKSTTDYTAMLGQRVCFVAKDKDTVYGCYAKDSQVVLTGVVGNLPKLANDDTSFKVNGTKYEMDNNTVAATPVYYFQNGVNVIDASAGYTAPNTWVKNYLYYNQTATAGADASTAVTKTDVTAPKTLAQLAGKYVTAFNVDNTATPAINDVKMIQAAGNNITSYDALKFSAVDKDGDGDIDFFMVMPAYVTKVNYVSGTDFKVKNVTSSVISDKFSTDDTIAYSGIAKDDYAIYTPKIFTALGKDTFEKATTLSGKITSVDAPDVSIDGTWYSYDQNYVDRNGNPGVGNTLSTAPVYNGYIFDADSTSKKTVTDYAVICSIQDGSGLVAGAQAKLLFSDGTKSVVDLKYNYADATTATSNSYGKQGAAADQGDLVTYTKNSDNEYTLTYANVADAGFDKTAAITAYGGTYNTTSTKILAGKASNDSTKTGYLNTWNIADDAVIFVQYDGAASYKKITGAQLKTMTASQFTGYFVLASKQTGNSNSYNVNMAYVTTNQTDVKTADTYYGYVLSVNETQNSDNVTVKSVKVLTKDGEKTYLTDGKIAGYDAIAKRAVIEFKLNSDGEMSEIEKSGSGKNAYGYSVDGSVYTEPTTVANTDYYGYATIGITSYGATLKFKPLESADTKGVTTTTETVMVNGKYFENDDDITTLYIDNSDAVAATKTDITPANDASTSRSDDLVTNAFIIFDKDGNIQLMVYDTDGEITQ